VCVCVCVCVIVCDCVCLCVWTLVGNYEQCVTFLSHFLLIYLYQRTDYKSVLATKRVSIFLQNV